MAKNHKTDEKKRRIEDYERICASMAEQGYRSSCGTISVVKANLYALIATVPLVAAGMAAYFGRWGAGELSIEISWNIMIFYLFLLVSIPVHELIHGITWSIFCRKGWKSIRFGVIWSMLTPYCHCKEPLKFRSYIAGGLMPLMVLGFIPFLAALATGNGWVLWFSILNVVAAGGDIIIALMLLKYRDAEIGFS